MSRYMLSALAILLLSVGFVTSEDFRGRITKIEDGKLTLVNKKADFDKTFEISKDCKVYKKEGKDGEPQPVADGVKGIELGDKGAFGMVKTNDDGKVVEITIMRKK